MHTLALLALGFIAGLSVSIAFLKKISDFETRLHARYDAFQIAVATDLHKTAARLQGAPAAVEAVAKSEVAAIAVAAENKIP